MKTCIYIYKYSKKIIFIRFTHVECDGDDVKAHSGVCDTAEGGRLARRGNNN